MSGSAKVFYGYLRGIARLNLAQNERLNEFLRQQKRFLPILQAKIQVTDQNAFVQLDCKFILSSKFLEGIDPSVRFFTTKKFLLKNS